MFTKKLIICPPDCSEKVHINPSRAFFFNDINGLLVMRLEVFYTLTLILTIITTASLMQLPYFAATLSIVMKY